MKQLIDIGLIDRNKGQIDGLPKNPRLIKDQKFELLVQSVKDDPELLEHRGLLVFPFEGRYITIGGNMRLEAMKKAGMKQAWCEILDAETPVSKLRAFLLKDNASFGEWDWGDLWAEFDESEISLAGIDIPPIDIADDELEAEEDDYQVPDDVEEIQTNIKPGDLIEFKKGAICHRLLCGDSTKAEDVAKLMGGRLADLAVTDPPYNVDYTGGTGMKIQNDNMSDGNFRAFLVDAFTRMNEVMKPGAAFYIWHADSEGFNFRAAAKDAGWKIRQCLIWVKNSLVMGRQDYQWKHEPCQPAGTMVRVPEGWKAIEELTDGDRVVAFDTYSGSLKGLREGIEIKTASREYDGQMYKISCGGHKTKATDNHHFSIRFQQTPDKPYCVYLMQRGNWFRVGRTVTYDARQFGLKTRMHQEKADRAWIICTFKTKLQAQMGEQLLAAKYGIPYTHWEPEKPYCKKNENARTSDLIGWLYDRLDADQQEERAKRLLSDFGRNYQYPLLDRETIKSKFSRRVTAKINACNLISGLMQLPISLDGYVKDSTFEWRDIDAVEFSKFTGRVYSLSVPKWEHYIADGIITHNCLYGWKEGAGHYFIDDRTNTTVYEDRIDVKKLKKDEMIRMLEEMLSEKIATTVIHEDKPSRNDLHPTMKPIRLIARSLRNSSKQGQVVLDLFGGSGSTKVAGHQLARNVYTMEMDEKYCQVIVDRMAELTRIFNYSSMERKRGDKWAEEENTNKK